MKRGLLFAIFLILFAVNGALAGSASLEGCWDGEARAILPDGSTLVGIPLQGEVYEVDDGLFSASFTFKLPDGDHTAYATGSIVAQKIDGIMSIDAQTISGYQGIALFEAKLIGKKLVGILRDFSDGSTSFFSAKRIDCE
jgi:hypothetical protein